MAQQEDSEAGQQASGASHGVPLGVRGRTALGAYFVVVSLLLGYMVLALWPGEAPITPQQTPAAALATASNSQATAQQMDNSTVTLFWGLVRFSPSAEVRLILLVMIVGGLGSYVHAATSFADYVGNRKMYTSWAWWYILRLFIGASLALIFYFVIRGGLLSAGATAADVSTFGIAAVAALAGLFSKQAADKLREVFDELFKVREEHRGDKLGDGPGGDSSGQA